MLDFKNVNTKEDIIKRVFFLAFLIIIVLRIILLPLQKKETDLTLVMIIMILIFIFLIRYTIFFQTQAMKRLGPLVSFFTVNIFPNTYHNRLEHSKGVYNRKSWRVYI